MKARCCWCGGGFIKIDGVWWCQTPACADRQAEYAIALFDTTTRSRVPFYVPLPKQIDFDTSRTPMLLGGGAAGASKSHMARYGLYRRALQIPGFEALILRKTWGELEKHHLRLMEREASRLRLMGMPVSFSKTDREFRIHHTEGTSVIEGGHMENPDDIEKYLSRERDAIVADEGATFDPRHLLELSTRARSSKPAVAAYARTLYGLAPHQEPPRGGAVFWILSNPGGPASMMLRDFFIDHAPDISEFPQLAETDADDRPLYDPTEWGYIPGNLEDNPYLPESYERDLALLPPWRYRQLRYNDWSVIAGQFFVEFDSRIHVKQLPARGGDYFRSYDYGYIHKGVCHWWRLLGDGRLHIAREYVHQYQPISTICREIRAITRDLHADRIRYTVADKYSMGSRHSDDSGETRAEAFTREGVPVVSTSHDRVQGWTRVRDLFHLRSDQRPWLTIDPSCTYLIRVLASAISDKHNPEDVAESNDDHPLSSLRYGAMSRPPLRADRPPPLPPHAAGRLLREAQRGSHPSPFAFR